MFTMKSIKNTIRILSPNKIKEIYTKTKVMNLNIKTLVN